MKLKKICRIESYPIDSDSVCEWNNLFFLDLRNNKKQWFDDNYDPIDNPLIGYNMKKFYQTVNKIWKMENNHNGCYKENDKEEEFDIMFEDQDIFPYESWSKNNVYEEIDKSYWRNYKKLKH